MKLLRCKLKGHSLKEIASGNFQLKSFECTYCHQKYTTDGYGRLVKFNSYWEKNHSFFQKHFSEEVISR